MTLSADEFITRFLWHVLPKGYHRIRHYGFLNNGQKHANLALIREILGCLVPSTDSAEAAADNEEIGRACPKCG